MPLELDAEDDFELVPVVAAPDELELWVDCVVDLEDEPEELEPQAATPRATSTSSAAANLRGDLVMVVFMSLLLRCQARANPGSSTTTPCADISFPRTLAPAEPRRREEDRCFGVLGSRAS